MQRHASFPLLFLVGLLYWAAGAIATGAAHAQTQPTPGAVPLPAPTQPHIAVLLPLQAPALARVADAVRQGIYAAAAAHKGLGLPLMLYATGDDAFDILSVYEKAMAGDARLVIGPLTRSAVSALAGSNLVNVPTVALNAPETELPAPPNLFVFGIQIDNDARQVARMARDDGRRRAAVVGSEGLLSKRLVQAFTEEWQKLGGKIVEQFAAGTDQASLLKLKEAMATTSADMVFLALDAEPAKVVRSYLGVTLPIYATSLVFNTLQPLSNFELNGVIFVDMPWLLVQDHAAVMAYTRPETLTSLDSQRFFALGIDAYRIAENLIRPPKDPWPLDGVSGTITLDSNRRLVRELVPAQFVNGEAKQIKRTEKE